ncbi:helix-turn-helix domain-containing protein [Cohnella fermenti]|uniref:Helix-turn-helix domain-containing protein n=1 Tax=Cohnella fermenti TaxID=2565925 RepID=A0A4S4C8V6_9BACL|nr:helix-turn-helix domain-containing protein [Cohnella fermenti]THF84451.1 helix-turn-helix domain-containing protein [Cohnella fermenti]
MTTKQEIQHRLDQLIIRADPSIAIELRELKRQIADSKEIGVSILSISSEKLKKTMAGSGQLRSRRPHNVLKEVLLPNEDYYTVEEVAKRFGVTRQAVHKWISMEKIKYLAPTDGKKKGYLIPKNQFKLEKSRSAEFRKRRNAIFGEGELSLTDAHDVFRNGEVEE